MADGVDNCPALANPDQIDCDEDGVGDACDDEVVLPGGEDVTGGDGEDVTGGDGGQTAPCEDAGGGCSAGAGGGGSAALPVLALLLALALPNRRRRGARTSPQAG